MGEPRRTHQLIFQVVGRKQMPKLGDRYPAVSYRSKTDLRAAVVAAARAYWPALQQPYVTFDGSDWRQCRGRLAIALPGGLQVDARFFPVFDPTRPAEEQARRPEGDR